jgi:hypothetical protein
MINVYKKHSRISTSKFREILRLFLLDIDATKTSKIMNVSRQSHKWYRKFLGTM